MAKNKGMNQVAAGLVGAAVELTDEKNRKTVQEKLGELRKEGKKAYSELKKTATEIKDIVEEVKGNTEKKIQKSATHRSRS